MTMRRRTVRLPADERIFAVTVMPTRPLRRSWRLRRRSAFGVSLSQKRCSRPTRLVLNQRFCFLITRLAISVLGFFAFLPFFLAGFGALSILALKRSLHLTSHFA